MKKISAIIAIAFITSLIASCASTPNKLGYYYSYKTPSNIAEADDIGCARIAEAKVKTYATNTPNWPAGVAGPVSAVIYLTWIMHKVDSIYEEAMKSCLREKGYAIPD